MPIGNLLEERPRAGEGKSRKKFPRGRSRFSSRSARYPRGGVGQMEAGLWEKARQWMDTVLERNVPQVSELRPWDGLSQRVLGKPLRLFKNCF